MAKMQNHYILIKTPGIFPGFKISPKQEREETMNTTIICPICGFRAQIDDFVEGITVECPKCGEKFSLDASVIDTEHDAVPPQTPPILPPPPVDRPTEQAKKEEEFPQGKQIVNAESAKGSQKRSQGPFTPEGEIREFPEKPYSTPTLAKILHFVSILVLLGGGLVFLASLSTGDARVLGCGLGVLVASIIFALIISGFEQIIVYIAEMHFHTIRQTNLMIRMLNRGASSRK